MTSSWLWRLAETWLMKTCQQTQLEDTDIDLSRDMTFQAPKSPPGDLQLWLMMSGWHEGLPEGGGINGHSEFCLCSCLLIPLLGPSASGLRSPVICLPLMGNRQPVWHHLLLPHIPECVLQDCGRNSWRHPSPAQPGSPLKGHLFLQRPISSLSNFYFKAWGNFSNCFFVAYVFRLFIITVD